MKLQAEITGIHETAAADKEGIIKDDIQVQDFLQPWARSYIQFSRKNSVCGNGLPLPCFLIQESP